MNLLQGLTMGKDGWTNADHGLPMFTWKEIEVHKDRNDRWIVINGIVYDVTLWAKRHPGGEKIISGYAGHDASVSMSFLSYFRLSRGRLGHSSDTMCELLLFGCWL